MARQNQDGGAPGAPRPSRQGRTRYSGGLLWLLFLLGAAVLFYPAASNFYTQWRYGREIAAWEEQQRQDNLPLWAAAENYNNALREKANPLAVSPEERAELAGYLNPLGTGMMGYLTVEKIGICLPIYQGTEERSLQSGCGWWPGTSLPTGGSGTHCVLTAHSGLSKAKLFTDLDQLETGDRFSLSILERTLEYEVDQILVTEPEDLSPLAIVPDADLVTLYTCTPCGVNTHRLLVRGHRVAEPSEEERAASAAAVWQWAALGGLTRGGGALVRIPAAAETSSVRKGNADMKRAIQRIRRWLASAAALVLVSLMAAAAEGRLHGQLPV